MKVPLEKEPFAPVTLSSDQETQLKWLSNAMVDATYAQYEEFVRKHKRVLEKDKWKPVISRENVTIYRRTGRGDLGAHTPQINLEDPTAKPTSQYWRVPVAHGIGTIAGGLDDMLYGLLAMTRTESDIRTTYIKDQVPDSRVLATVIKPTREDPLQALVLRWSLVYQPVHKIGMVTPRDVVYLESTGSRVLPDGERIGYFVIQSVDVPGCGELTDLGILRCKWSTCYLFRDTGNGTVELYMRTSLDPGGRLGDRLTVFMACTSLISIWRVMLCGQYKKLSWMLRRAMKSRSSGISGPNASGSGDSCPICEKGLSGSLRSASQCDICMDWVCSRCNDKRKLTQVVSSTKITRVTMCVCRTCISVGGRTSAREVALSEYVADSDEKASWSSTPSVLSPNQRSHATSVSSSSSSMGASIHDSMRGSFIKSPAFANNSGSPDAVSGIDDHEAYASMDPEQLQLWMRMNQLRMAAEETYMIAKQNGAVMLETLSASDTAQVEIGPDRQRTLTVEEVE